MSGSISFPKEISDSKKLLTQLKTNPEPYWIRRGETRTLKLFHLMARRVPAYKDFLKKHHIDERAIKTIRDLAAIPTIDKDNYLRAYPLEQLCWDGTLKGKSWTIAATSGSTGEPFYFPREKEQDLQYAATAELYLLNTFQIDKKSTLYINGFGMGIWIGGVFTYQAIRLVADKGYPLSIITPGSSKIEIIKAVKNLGSKFDQIIIAGYPPLIKDTIDEGIANGFDWKTYNIRFIFSAEGFSEQFRDYISEKTGLKNIFTDSLNHYGTVDLGTMAHETPVCILIRRLATKNKKLAVALFGNETRLPTLTQFLPEMFYFEKINDELACSAFSGLPLLRYNLKDTGDVVTLSMMETIFDKHGINLHAEMKKTGIADILWNLPFVFVFERSDFTVKLSGANIYPDEIRRALQKSHFAPHLTGKFTMVIRFDTNQDQYMEINCELKKDAQQTDALTKKTGDAIVEQLLEDNSEYRYLYSLLPKTRLIPRLIFWPYEDSTFFKPGGKQKWVKKL